MNKRSIFLLFGGLFLADASVIPRRPVVVSSETARSTSYDFVIAGGGLAGLTLADRLTENAKGLHNLISSSSVMGGEY
jgi:hypothetical protein